MCSLTKPHGLSAPACDLTLCHTRKTMLLRTAICNQQACDTGSIGQAVLCTSASVEQPILLSLAAYNERPTASELAAACKCLFRFGGCIDKLNFPCSMQPATAWSCWTSLAVGPALLMGTASRTQCCIMFPAALPVALCLPLTTMGLQQTSPELQM